MTGSPYGSDAAPRHAVPRRSFMRSRKPRHFITLPADLRFLHVIERSGRNLSKTTRQQEFRTRTQVGTKHPILFTLV